MSKPRVLIIAEEANPEWVSVPLVGWSLATALSGITDAHIVTQIRNAEAFGRSKLSPETYTIIDNEYLARPMWRLASLLRGGSGKGWTTLTAFKALIYWSFEREVWKHFAGRIASGKYDVVHRVTPLSPTIPSLLAGRCRAAGVPFVLGPLNGGVPWPPGFRKARHKEKEWLSYLRSAYKLLPGYKATLRHSSAIICASEHTLSEIPGLHREKCFYLPENGVESSSIAPQPAYHEPATPLRFVFVGRLVPYKGADMAIEAARDLLLDRRCTLDIVGDGPERQRLEDLALQLGLRDRVRFLGWLDHPSVMRHLSDCHAMIFPSIREFGGGVVLEAMARGVLPLVVAYGGPGELVSSGCGIGIPLGQREDIISSIKTQLDTLLSRSDAMHSARAACIDMARTSFTWEAKARQILRVYEWLLGGPKPPHNLLLPPQ